jgi:hypothetical protein
VSLVEGERDGTRGLFARVWAGIEAKFLDPVDTRAYAAVRISYALACFWVLCEMWPERAAYLSDRGMVGSLVKVWLIPFSHDRSQLTVSAVTLLALFASVTLMFGILPRVSAALLFVWHISLSSTAYIVLSGYDVLLRMVGFLVLLSPSARRWSVLTRLGGPRDLEAPVYALRLIQFQTCVMYWHTVWLKLPQPVWRSGMLVSYFQMSLYSRLPSTFWADHPRVSVLLSWGTLATESLLPVLLVWRPTRRLGMLLGLSFHASIAFTSTLGTFSLAMLPLYASFLRDEDFRWLTRLGGEPSRSG